MGLDVKPETRTYILAELVQLLTRCIKLLNEHLNKDLMSDNASKLAVVLIGLLHLCRRGHVVESESSADSELKSITTPVIPDSSQNEDDADNKSPPKRSCKRMKQMISDSGRASDLKSKSKSKLKPKQPKKPSRDSELCTFTTTGDQFVEQHWYFCYTCCLTGTEGVCTVCARRCHSGHDIAYSRHSRFFCDCGAAGSESNQVSSIPPPPSHPAGSSDSEVSIDRREFNKREKRSSPKRWRCISLSYNSDHSDCTSSTRPDLTPRSEPTERSAMRCKDPIRSSKDEVNLLTFASPLIGQCLSSYSASNFEGTRDNDFESSIRSSDTVNCVLDLAQCLLDQDDFFRGEMGATNRRDNLTYKWKPVREDLTADVPDSTIETATVAEIPPGRLIKALKGGGFSFPSKHNKSVDVGAFGVPMALSCVGEYLALGQDKGTVLIVKAPAVVSCKSSLERSSLLRLGEINVSHNVRHLAFHPEKEEVLLIVGDTAVSVVILSFHPYVERTRLHLSWVLICSIKE